jgi:ATP-binding cassette subfamily B (MDR/TAP) protein 1
VKKAYVAFLINAVVVFLFSWIMFSSWMITSERQSIKCRKLYFEALMHQEVAWYDHTRIQELASNVYSESSQLQNAIGEKVSKIFMTTSMGIAGFVIAFVRGWKLAIVVTSVIPFLLLAGFFNNHFLKQASDFMAKITCRAQGMAEEVLFSIKTVKVLNGESFESDNYRTQISRATEKAIDYGYIRGTMTSLFFFSIIMTYTIGFWYGTVLVSQR